MRVNLTTYLSSRHHPEAWVKGGYLLVDAAPFPGVEALDNVMQYLTVKVGHFEINYGGDRAGSRFYSVFDTETASGLSHDCEYVALATDLDVPLLTYDRPVLCASPDTAVRPDRFAGGS